MRTLKTPNRLGLSLANIDATARAVDWTADPDDPAHVGVGLVYDRDYELIIPDPTYQDLAERAPDLLTGRQQSAAWSHRIVSDRLGEQFEEASAYGEWRAGFDPMMNFVWPVNLAYQVEASTAAQLIAEFAPVCTLVSFNDSELIGEEYGLALAGGGMNLADQIAVAYLCCGCVPPAPLLSELSGVMDSWKVRQTRTALRAAFKSAADYYTGRAQRLREDGRVLLAKAKPKT